MDKLYFVTAEWHTSDASHDECCDGQVLETRREFKFGHKFPGLEAFVPCICFESEEGFVTPGRCVCVSREATDLEAEAFRSGMRHEKAFQVSMSN